MTDALNFDSAQRLITRATDMAARDFRRPICVSICDEYGFLLAFGRMDSAPLRSIAISQRKAYTAARMGISTESFLARLQKDNLQASYYGEDMVPLPGGNVLKDGAGRVVGSVGVSGLAVHEDQAIADAVAEFAASEQPPSVARKIA
jgi:glc operon protein GlcG